MFVVLSPAKNLDFSPTEKILLDSEISFPKETKKLISILKKKKAQELSDLMHISPALGQLNYERFHDFEFPFVAEKTKQAVFAFNGEVYNGLNIESFTAEELLYTNQKLRILSGLYGILRPSDCIMPYRLEMGTRLLISDKIKNLYSYWDEKLAIFLHNEMKEQAEKTLVNLASTEYFKSLQNKKLQANVITCHFKEKKGNDYKIVMMYAKKARGLMASFILKNKLTKPEELRLFQEDGYLYHEGLSTESDLVFTRG